MQTFSDYQYINLRHNLDSIVAKLYLDAETNNSNRSAKFDILLSYNKSK